MLIRGKMIETSVERIIEDGRQSLLTKVSALLDVGSQNLLPAGIR
jgi:hypothetical protein